MSRPEAEAVLGDRQRDQGVEPAPQGSPEALRLAAKLQTPTGWDVDAKGSADPVTAALAREVVEGATFEECLGVLFPSMRR